jgi:glycosyltransferase involved in cell wall biosynthesis
MFLLPASLTRPRGETQPVKVIHLDHSVESGGAELALLRLLRQRTQWTPTLRAPLSGVTAEGVFEPLASEQRVTLEAAGSSQRPGASGHKLGFLRIAAFARDALVEAATLRRSAGFAEADVVHANTSRSAVYGAVACLFSRKLLVVHLRDMTSKESLGPVGFQLFSRVALRRANGVIANSEATLSSAAMYLRPRVMRIVIPSPIGFDSRPALGAPREAVSDTPLVVGMVARIDAWKGHDLLLEAFAHCSEGPKKRLRLAGGAAFGKSEDLVALQAKAEKLGIASQVDFLGHVENVHDFVDSLDICVQASIRPEPLGQNVLQYLAAGKPTIAINAGGPTEWIESGQNGLLVEMGSVDAMANALQLLLSDSGLRTRLGLAARETPGILSDAEVADQHGDFFAMLTKRRERVIS